MATRTKRIKILLDIHPFHMGGMERFLFRLLKGLDKKRFEPIVISQARGSPLRSLEELGIDLHVVPWRRHDEGVEALRSFIKRSGAALVQSNSCAAAMGTAALQCGIPHIWRVGGHVDITQRHMRPAGRRAFLSLVSLLSREIVCPSEFLASQFKRIGARNARVIYNGVDLESIPRPRPGKPRGPARALPQVGMIAHFFDQKRHVDFVRAAALIKATTPCEFLIYGSSKGSLESARYLAGIKRLIARLGLESDFTITERLQNPMDAYKDLDIIVLPSIQEGASNVLLEAMALGKPVIAARSGGNPEFVETGVTGSLVAPKDPKALASSVLRILSLPDRGRALGFAGRAEAEARFDIRRTVAEYEELYSRSL